MGRRESYDAGIFSWIDLDHRRGRREGLYADLFGWDYDDQPIPAGGTYSIARVDGRAVAGLSEVQAEGQPPAWTAYVTVDDADATAAKAAELGGTLLAEPFDVMDAGRMAVIADPAGAILPSGRLAPRSAPSSSTATACSR